MKKIFLAMLLTLTGLGLWAQPMPVRPPLTPGIPPTIPPGLNRPGAPGAPSYPVGSGPDRRETPRSADNTNRVTPRFPANQPRPAATNAVPDEIIPANRINWQSVDVTQALEIYAQYVNRTLLRPATLPAANIVLHLQTDLSKSEVIQAMEAVFAMNGIAVVNIGDKFVKAGPLAEASAMADKIRDADTAILPELGSFVTVVKQLDYVKPSAMVPFLQAFTKQPNAAFPIDDNGILVLRDTPENVQRMLEMISRIDVAVPLDYVSEVIPILYADAGDIASALTSLGGNGGATISFGASTSSGPISGLRGGNTGMGGMGGMGGSSFPGSGTTSGFNRQTGVTGPSGTPATGNTFQNRINSLLNRAASGSQDQIQVFGQAKIVADQRSNSLLVFATKADIDRIRKVVEQLDVLLAQVLIESIIMDVSINKTLDYGVSAAQKPVGRGNSTAVAGGMNNGGPFYSYLRNMSTNSGASGTNSLVNLFTGSLPNGLSYFGNLGPTWDLAVTAALNDNHASVIQRPRIQTSQAKPAQFFVGTTVPYINNTYSGSYGYGYGGSSYSQLSVGVELDVTPFINPDGLVVMDIQQEIDEISGYTVIDNNKVPNTTRRSLSTEIAVKDQDTVILGGFVRSDKSNSRSGVPVLMDIPILGKLFSSNSDSKDRSELIVLMRPTVLKTPEIAAKQTIIEAQRLPGVSDAAADNAAFERSLIDAQRKKEQQRVHSGQEADGFFNMDPEGYGTNGAGSGFGSAPRSSAHSSKTNAVPGNTSAVPAKP